LQLAARWPPGAAILDIAMPGKNGYDVAWAMRVRLAHRVVLIAHGGQLTIQHRDTAAASLFDLCHTKGMEFAGLREQLENLLKSSPNPASGGNAAPSESKGGSKDGSRGGSTGGPAAPARTR
jgi:DNA-binding response OmpR family regulator